jgi:hypothetical protein
MRILQILITILFLGFQSGGAVPEQLAASDKYRLVWNDDPGSTMTIAWDQIDSTGYPVVCYGETDYEREYQKYTSKQAVTRIVRHYQMNTHFAKLTGLKGNTAYFFVIKDNHGVSKRFWFRTAPTTPLPFTFIAGGDTKSNGQPLEVSQNSNRLVAKLRPLFVYFNGDFTSGDGTNPENWKKWLSDWQEMTTTDDGRMIPLVPVHGNHENGDRANLNYLFNVPYDDNDPAKIYYALSFGGNFFHMVQLNSEIEEGGRQKEWLKNDLEKHQDYTFKVAAYHKPFWPHTKSKGGNKYQFEQWANLFYKYRLNLSFDADSHMLKITYPVVPDSSVNSFLGYIRNDKNGTMFLGEGSWGAAPRPNDSDKPWTLTSGSFNQVQWIHVLPATDEEEAHMKIFTLISARYDANNKLTLFNREVEPLNETNLFDLPKNIILHMTTSTGSFVRYPFIEKIDLK